MGESIDIVVGPDGSVVVSVKGVKGKSCKDVTKQIEAALGRVTSDRATDEMYQDGGRNVVKS